MSTDLGSVSCWMGKLREKFNSFSLEAKEAKKILHHNRVEHVQEQLIAAGESIKHFCLQLKEDIYSCSGVKLPANISSHGDEVVESLVPEFREENQELPSSAQSWTPGNNSDSDVSSEVPELDDESESELSCDEFVNEESYITSSSPDLRELVGKLTPSELLHLHSFANPEYISFEQVFSNSHFGPSLSQIYGFQPPFFMTDCSKLDLNMLPNLGTEGTDASSECELNVDLSFLDSDHNSDIDQDLQSGVLDMNAPISDSDKEFEVSEAISIEEFRHTDTSMGSTSPTQLGEDVANYEAELENASQSGENAEDSEWERVVDEGFVDADWEIISEN